MSTENLVDMLRTHPFVEGCRPEHIEKLASMAARVQFEKNAIIFREGDESSFFYLLFSGSVVLEITGAGRAHRIQTLGKGEELGWSSMTPSMAKKFQARVLEPVTALAFDGARLRRACDEDCAFGYAITQRLLETISSRLQAARMQLLDLYAPAKMGAPGKPGA